MPAVIGCLVGSFGSVVLLVGLAGWSIQVTLAGAAITMIGGYLCSI